MSESQLRKVTVAQPEAELRKIPALEFKTQIAKDNLVTVKRQLHLLFFSSRT